MGYLKYTSYFVSCQDILKVKFPIRKLPLSIFNGNIIIYIESFSDTLYKGQVIN
nr:MAG TPA: hypothetical protein [Caudoviricetes sp.]